MKLDYLLSIGRACRTRYQIERIMKNRRPGWTQQSHFFDWLMTDALDSVSVVIERGFKFSADEFECSAMTNGRCAPLHRPSGYRFLHDFGFADVITDLAQATALMQDNMDATLAKFTHLGRRTDELLRSSDAVGLVYVGPVTEAQVDRLSDALWNRYGRHFTFINVLVHEWQQPITHKVVMTVHAVGEGPIGPLEWTGNNATWDAAFANIETA